MTSHAPLIIDVAGLALTETDRRRLKNPLTGGIILFARNWQSRQQLSDLCADIKSIRKDLLICVDQEGGRVQRFKTDGFTPLPPMRALGEQWMKDPLAATNTATACGYVLGAELRACGVDLSFTPVLDLDYENGAPAQTQAPAAPRDGAGGLGRLGTSRSSVIGDRAFARDPRVVALLAKSLMHGLLQAGMANCGKHFPGHGFVTADSHTAIPIDKRSLKAILADDAAPYDWLNTALTSVMPAHVIYPKIDTRPAGFSEKWLTFILRGQLGFGGAIFSDDLSMAGARLIDGKEVSYSQAAMAALNAGCDMALLCNQSIDGGEALDELLAGMAESLVEGRWEALESSEMRRRDLLPLAPAPTWDELMLHPAYMHAMGLVT